MSNDNDRKLPVRYPGDSPVPSIFTPHPAHTGGIVDTWVTRWQAKRKTAAHSELAALNRAKRDQLDAYGEMAQSYMRTSRIVHQLDELPDILALDRAERKDQREAAYEQIEFRKEEREHEAEIAQRRRLREIENADRRVVEAQRGKFNTEQGLENQQRLKQVNLEIWENRKQADLADATRIRSLLHDELRGHKKEADSAESIRTRAQQALIEALADGNEAEADRWQRVLDALEEK